ncbi:MAG: DUF565 domain-containing protein [Cyanobium sp.]|jgi:hypothetical protein|uniref:DUF565 domain-containing protein n=1 Tax=Synechococcus sp. CS-1333 TaxID=2848638 RepID=UPI000DBBC49F|nr:DUF565 domain-containing protein [Synechococcus sp. CS-1333]MCT0210041.1 DUF565 domain-containing protein [Synechococcus sp. CS-1333]PZV25090.1 MAG: DUF565 domain-containing protein [Cyanobium sp.]
MSTPPVQATRFQHLLDRSASALLQGVRGTWRRRSLSLIALLAGYFAGNNLTSYFLVTIGQRPVVVLLLVVLLEVLVRVRSHQVRGEPTLAWVICDHLRLGFVYAVVAEAFKLGS